MSKHGFKARYVAGLMPAVGSATLPQGSLYSVAAQGFSLIEASWFTVGATGGRRVALYRLTTAGTPGAAVTEAKYDDDAPTSLCQAFLTHTVAPTLGDRLTTMPVQNAAATGIYVGWHDRPIECPVGTANGVGFVPNPAAGNADVVFVWDE